MKMIKNLFVGLLILGLSFALSGCNDEQGQDSPKSKLTPQVQQSIDIALKATTITSRHELLDEGIKHCRTVDDIKALAQKANTITKRHEIMAKGIHLCKNVDEIVGLALMANTATFCHEILRQGVPLSKNVDDIIKLAKRAHTVTVKHELLRAGVPLAKTSADILKLANQANTKTFQNELLKLAPQHIQPAPLPSASVAGSDDNALMKAQQEMLAAQALYNQASMNQSNAAELKKLSDDYLQKKNLFESLKDQR